MLHRVSRVIYSNNPVRAFILVMTVGLLQPTNFPFAPTVPGTHLPQHPCNGQHGTRWFLRHMCKSSFTIIIHTWDKVQELRSQAHCCPRWERYVGPTGVQCGANRCAWTKDHPELFLTASSATEGSHAPHEAAAAPRVQGMYQFAKHCSRSTRPCRRRRRGQTLRMGGAGAPKEAGVTHS